MKFSKIQQRFKEMDYLIKMKLDKLLEQRHKKEIGKEPTKIDEVYGIIYRIYCIPENKSYIGQTLSHGYINGKLSRKGLITRIRTHYNEKCLDKNMNKSLSIALTKYEPNQFEIFEEEKIYCKELAFINIKEGECIKKYNSLIPNGYNTEEIGKIYSQLLKDLSNFYEFDYILGVESRGFIFGAAIAQVSKKGLVLARKPNKLPREVYSENYGLEYGVDSLQIQQNILPKDARVLLIDDVLATGGTLVAAANLVRKSGAHVEGTLVLLEISELMGNQKLALENIQSKSLIQI
jgi:adenine phosphoribosyltransferase